MEAICHQPLRRAVDWIMKFEHAYCRSRLAPAAAPDVERCDGAPTCEGGTYVSRARQSWFFVSTNRSAV
jgi:hypothetical protein